MSESLLLSYRFGSGGLTSRDGSHALEGHRGTVVAGPGATALGSFPEAMRFDGEAWLHTGVAPGEVPDRSFTVRVLVQPSAGTGSELVCRCDAPPFRLWLTPTDDPARRGLLGLIEAQAHGTQGIGSARVGVTLQAGRWYVVDLVFAFDTLGLFVDGALVHAFGLADGRLNTVPGTLEVGGRANDPATRFQGALAALQVHSGAPVPLERALEAGRDTPMWHLTRKFTLLNAAARLGPAVGGPVPGPARDARVLRFERGLMIYQPRMGAFALDGDLAHAYDRLHDAERRRLGALTSDPVALENPPCRYARFTGGALFVSPRTGAATVTGRIYQRYMQRGGPAGYAGLPRGGAVGSRQGREQPFERARYFEPAAATEAYELGGGILRKYRAMGGVAACGWPLGEVNGIERDGRHLGARADFERCSIFHHEPGEPHDTVPYAVPGDFLAVHSASGGVDGDLGFPAGDVARSGIGSWYTEYQAFERGSIVRMPGQAPVACPRFELFLKRMDTDESEGIGAGENDVYFFLKVTRTAPGRPDEVLFDERFPAHGDYGERNIVELDVTLPVQFDTSDPAVVYRVEADVWDSDSLGTGGDDHLGTPVYELSVFNAWGQGTSEGVISAHDRDATLLMAVHPCFDRANYGFVEWNFFRFENPHTQTIRWRAFATAFAGDVGSDVSIDDVLLDPIGTLTAAIVYEIAKGLARRGNCWGISVEALQAWKGVSLFSPPLHRYEWSTCEPEINVKHISQVGLENLQYAVREFVQERTQDPVAVFRATQAAAARGELAMLTVMQRPDVTDPGLWHAIAAYAWDDTTDPWTIRCYDPNNPYETVLSVWPDQNRWTMTSDEVVLEGGYHTGARLIMSPASIVTRIPQRLPSLVQWLDLGLQLGFALLHINVEPIGMVDSDGQEMDITRATAADRRRRRFMLAPYPMQPQGPAGPQIWMRHPDTGSVNYQHALRLGPAVGPRNPWRYAVSFGQGELYFAGTGAPGDRLSLRFESVGLRRSRCTVSGTGGGRFTVAYVSRLDEEGAQAKMVLQDLPVRAEGVSFSWNPALEGFEVLAPGAGAIPLTVTHHRGGASSRRDYTLPPDSGARVRISNAVETGELPVYRIAALNGVSWGETVLAPNG